MAAPRRLLLGFAAIALAMVALVSASGYDGSDLSDQTAAVHRLPRSPGAFVSTAPVLVQRASLPTNERRAPRTSGFVLLAAFAALAAAVASRVPERLSDQAVVWRATACGRRGPPAPVFA